MKQWIVKMKYGDMVATYLVCGEERFEKDYGHVLRGHFKLLRTSDGFNDIHDEFVAFGVFPKSEIVELFELT